MFAGLDRVQLVGLFSADFFRVKIRFTVAHSLFFSLSFLLGLLSVSLTHSLLPLAIFTVRILFSALIFLGQFFSLFFLRFTVSVLPVWKKLQCLRWMILTSRRRPRPRRDPAGYTLPTHTSRISVRGGERGGVWKKKGRGKIDISHTE